MSNHALEDYFTDDEISQARGAAGMAICLGSQGAKERREYCKADGTLTSATEMEVARIDQGQAFQITTHQNMVIVMPGRPGRFQSHALADGACVACHEADCKNIGRGMHQRNGSAHQVG